MSYMDLRSDVEAGRLTLSEAAELSRLLEEKWGVGSAAAEEQGDLEADFIAPLLARIAGVGLSPPDEHLAAVRASLVRALAP